MEKNMRDQNITDEPKLSIPMIFILGLAPGPVVPFILETSYIIVAKTIKNPIFLIFLYIFSKTT